jgi:uncharacterized coiled-coil DUF342 family protein
MVARTKSNQAQQIQFLQEERAELEAKLKQVTDQLNAFKQRYDTLLASQLARREDGTREAPARNARDERF